MIKLHGKIGPKLGLFSAFAWVTVSYAGFAYAKQERISFIGSRPIAMLAYQLEENLGVAISYEDPVYFAPRDVEKTEVIARSGPNQWIITPRNQEITIDQIALPKGASKGDKRLYDVAATSLTQAIKSIAKVENAARFEIRRNDTWLEVVPTHIKLKDGTYVKFSPLLDTIITVDIDSDVYSAILKICDALSDATGQNVQDGIATANNAFMNTHVRVKPEPRKARDIISDILAHVDEYDNWSWEMMYHPEDKVWILSFSLAPGQYPMIPMPDMSPALLHSEQQ